MRARNYCFTFHYPEDVKEEDIDGSKYIIEHDKLRYAVWQLERCPSSGRLHLQGYVEYTSPLRLSAVKGHLGSTVHVEMRKGTRTQAAEYCRKPDSRVSGPWEYGSFGSISQGKRTDLDNLADRIQSGEKISTVVDEFPVAYIKYRRGIEALHNRYTQERALTWRDVTVLVFVGVSGTGKTRGAIEEGAKDFFILDQGDRLWFDGYEGQSTLIIDDFYSWIKWGTLLRLLDGHPYRCEIKGGFTWALWTKVIITSNANPVDWYPSVTDPIRRGALTRRISSTRTFE